MKHLFAAIALTVGTASAADAALFDFSYSTQSGITTTGTITATDLGGFYVVDDVSGSRDGQAITGYDFEDLTPQSFNVTGGQVSNLDFSYYIGALNYEIRWPGNGGTSYGTEFLTDAAGGVSSLLVTEFSLAPVPESATWAMMLAGFAGLGGVLRARARRRLSIA